MESGNPTVLPGSDGVLSRSLWTAGLQAKQEKGAKNSTKGDGAVRFSGNSLLGVEGSLASLGVSGFGLPHRQKGGGAQGSVNASAERPGEGKVCPSCLISKKNCHLVLVPVPIVR